MLVRFLISILRMIPLLLSLEVLSSSQAIFNWIDIKSLQQLYGEGYFHKKTILPPKDIRSLFLYLEKAYGHMLPVTSPLSRKSRPHLESFVFIKSLSSWWGPSSQGAPPHRPFLPREDSFIPKLHGECVWKVLVLKYILGQEVLHNLLICWSDVFKPLNSFIWL